MNRFYLFALVLFVTFIFLQKSAAQSVDCPYPIILIHGFTGDQTSFEDVYTSPEFIAVYGDLADTYHAVLNATDNSNIWGDDGVQGTADDDVLLSFDNESNTLAAGNVYTVNFNNFWNEDESNPEIDINGCGSPGFDESDSNESAILKGGYALSDMIQKVLDANPDKDKVILVGHSMGGLTAREYLQRTEDNNNSSDPRWWIEPTEADGHKVIKLITTVTPHRGSNFFGNPWPLKPDQADTRDGLPDISSEATRDLRYSYALGCGFLGLESCPGAYLFGGEEDDIWGYWNEDVDCDGDESSTIVGINEEGSPDPWDGTKDNPAMPLPTNLRYTWITSDILLDSGDGVVSWGRQWLYNGNTPVPSDGVAHRQTDTLLTDVGHLSVNSDDDLIVRALDEGDYPIYAWKVQLDNLTGGVVQVRSVDAPEGASTTDPDWFEVDIPNEVEGNLIITFNPHPSLSGQIDFFNTAPGNYTGMNIDGDHQQNFTPGNSTITMTIPESDYNPGTKHYFRIIHENIDYNDWHIKYDFELNIEAPLPVELISFTGEKSDDHVLLEWSTAVEYNSSEFEILRSFNGIEFDVIGKVSAAGFSQTVQLYDFIDRSPLVGNNYYRLRQVDLDGRIAYTNIVIIYFEQDIIEIHKVYPNPLRNQVSVEFYAYSEESVFINVYNAVGQLVLKEQVDVFEGNNRTTLNTSRLLDGIYILEIRQGNLSQQLRIVKQ